MALTAKSMEKKEEPKAEEPTHEVRLDAEGKGYLYLPGKEYKAEAEAPAKEESEEEPEVEEEKPKKRRGRK